MKQRLTRINSFNFETDIYGHLHIKLKRSCYVSGFDRRFRTLRKHFD